MNNSDDVIVNVCVFQPHASTDLQNLKKDLEGYREIILPFNKVLEWEKPHYPAILVGSITFIFS